MILTTPAPRFRRLVVAAVAGALMLVGLGTLDSAEAAAPKAVNRVARVALPPSGVVCSLVSDLKVCSHGDDAALNPQVSAAEGSSGQKLSTASTRIGCYGNGRSGPRVQTVYARPVGAADRLASLRPSFRGWAGAVDKAIDDSAHQTRGARHVRFVTKPTSNGCELDIASVALAPSAFTSFNATVAALQQRGMDVAGVKYLIWSDVTKLCGMASSFADSSPGADNPNNGLYPTYARVDRPCWGYAETHELAHMLGAVQRDAPHATAGFHCHDGNDVMCYDDGTAGSRQKSVCGSTQARLLDCRHDDYFSTAPVKGSWLANHWNVAMSSFLSPVWTSAEPAPAPAPAPADSSSGVNDSEPEPSPAPSPSATPLLPIL